MHFHILHTVYYIPFSSFVSNYNFDYFQIIVLHLLAFNFLYCSISLGTVGFLAILERALCFNQSMIQICQYIDKNKYNFAGFYVRNFVRSSERLFISKYMIVFRTCNVTCNSGGF